MHDVWNQIPSIVQMTLQGMINNPHFNIARSAHGAKMISIAKRVEDRYDFISHNLTDTLKTRFHLEFKKATSFKALVKGAVRETLFKGLNSIRCDLEFTAHLRKLLSAECVTEETDDLLLFLACFIRQFSSEIMKFVFRPEELSCSADGQDEEDISDNDQKVLYLVAGFVVFSIKKKCFQQKNNKTYIKVVKLLQMFIKNNETATKQYVVKHSEWIDKINRGGLVYPADDFFLLVREMENVMRKNINLKKLSSETLMKTVLTQYIMSS